VPGYATYGQVSDEEARALIRSTVGKQASEIQDSSTPALAALPPDDRLANAKADEAEEANKLRRLFSRALLGLMTVQIMGADAVFVVYASHVHWVIPTATMNVWLSSVVVQVIGTTGIVVHYLFPRREGKS
jgi:hypothetical protein